MTENAQFPCIPTCRCGGIIRTAIVFKTSQLDQNKEPKPGEIPRMVKIPASHAECFGGSRLSREIKSDDTIDFEVPGWPGPTPIVRVALAAAAVKSSPVQDITSLHVPVPIKPETPAADTPEERSSFKRRRQQESSSPTKMGLVARPTSLPHAVSGVNYGSGDGSQPKPSGSPPQMSAVGSPVWVVAPTGSTGWGQSGPSQKA